MLEFQTGLLNNDYMKKELLIVTISSLFIACVQYTKNNSIIRDNQVDKNIEFVIKEYMRNNRDINTFLLLTDYGKSNSISSNLKEFLVGPAYKGLFCNGEGSYSTYPTVYMKIGNNYVFIHSSSDFLLENKELISFYEKESIPLTTENSYSSCMTAFLSKAILFEVDVYKKQIRIKSQKPDTVFIKKRIEYLPPLYNCKSL